MFVYVSSQQGRKYSFRVFVIVIIRLSLSSIDNFDLQNWWEKYMLYNDSLMCLFLGRILAYILAKNLSDSAAGCMKQWTSV